ncbi:hypothetical protein HALDL1_03990 [Halobacterium sp. DL1]|jgi:hypothetical protein|nr:hypothetical protein HALDL1_03990 [Halobacterium sp. DL1]
MGEKTDGQDDGYGITDEDRVRIERYLQKEKHERSVEDLRPSSEK